MLFYYEFYLIFRLDLLFRRCHFKRFVVLAIIVCIVSYEAQRTFERKVYVTVNA